MNSRILVVSHPKLTAVIQQVVEGMDQLPEVTIRDVGFGDVIRFLHSNIPTLKPNIIITGGAHWEMLHQSEFSTSIPIIPIPVTRFDLLHAALQARQFGKRIAVIHFGDEFQECHDTLSNFDCNFQFFSYHTKEEAIALITSLKESGIDAIIGAGLVCAISDSFNIPSIFLHSKDSIIKILDHVNRLESARLDMVATAQKWSVEFMKNPVLTYEIDSNTKPNTPASSPFPEILKTRITDWSSLEKFLFEKKISTFITDQSKPFFDKSKPYIIFGCIESDDVNLDLFLKKLDTEQDIKLFYSVKKSQYRVIILSKSALTSEWLNKKLPHNMLHITGGMGNSIHYDELFLSQQNLENALFKAEVALELAKIIPNAGPILMLEEGNPFLIMFNMAIAGTLPNPSFLKPLLGHRNTEKLLTTLRLLLDHGLSITTVSHHLGFSRQTVYTLLNRIESLVGLLSDPEIRFALSFELRSYEMKKAIDTVNKAKKNATKVLLPTYQIV